MMRVGIAADHGGFALKMKITDALRAAGHEVGPALAWELVQTFVTARFGGDERHQRRLAKVAALENK